MTTFMGQELPPLRNGNVWAMLIENLRKVRPTHTIDDSRYSSVTDAKTPCQFDTSDSLRVKEANLDNMRCRDSIGTVRLSPSGQAFLSALCHHICHIGSVVTQKETVRITTGGIVTFMQNHIFFGNGAKVDFPREAMGTYRRAIHSQHSISLLVPASLPLPALVKHARGYVPPKTHYRRDVGSMSLDKADRFALDPSIFRSCFIGNAYGLTATAVAIAIGNFLRGFVRGMILHVNSPFVTLTKPPDGSNRRGGNLFPLSIIPQLIEGR